MTSDRHEASTLIACLLDPARVQRLAARDWDVLLRALRRNGLLAAFAERVVARNLFAEVPSKARDQIAYARLAADSTRTAVRFEVNRMLRGLRDYDGPLILLKGAAYELHGLPCAPGRMTGDVDVMVPRGRIAEVERMLLGQGWESTHADAYDQRYYREWSHELPPLLHPQRETPIDLHHTIAPPLSRTRVDSAALLAAAVPTATPRLQVLGPADMVIHSTIHMLNDEVGHPLRDLFDIHLLLTHFGATPAFWANVRARAALHGAGGALDSVLRLTRTVFGTRMPDDVAAAALASRPPWGALMDGLFRVRAAPGFARSARLGHRAVRGALYLRAHWHRMPATALLLHLARKGATRLRGPPRPPAQ